MKEATFIFCAVVLSALMGSTIVLVATSKFQPCFAAKDLTSNERYVSVDDVTAVWYTGKDGNTHVIPLCERSLPEDY